MEVSGTISSYLDGEDRFDYLFWTSYSMDPITIEFLFKNDLVRCLSKPYFHFICDKRKLDETTDNSLDDPKKINRLAKMQNYLLISKENVEGALHPKLLFLSSANKIRCIVLSGNATSSGILSNQDLIARFEWPGADGNEHQNEIAALYRFLMSFKGWNDESRSELESVANTHPWLLEREDSNVLFSDGEVSLMQQLLPRLPLESELEKISIFSPFVDPELKALSEFAKHFPNTDVELIHPKTQIEVNDPDIELPENLHLKSSISLNKARFHAKYYAFIGKNDVHAYWGSANCSFSALLSPSRNREVLIGYRLDKSMFSSLWPGADMNTKPISELVLATDSVDPSSPLEIDLIDGRIDEESIELTSKENFEKKQLRLVLFDGDEQVIESVSTSACKAEVSVKNARKVCSAYVSDSKGKKISNSLFLNNFGKIQDIVAGARETPDYDQMNKKKESLLRKLGTEFFIFDQDKQRTSRSARSNATSNAFAFWHLPKYHRRLSGAGIFGHKHFMSRYVGKHKKRIDPDGDDTKGDPSESFEHHRPVQDLQLLMAFNRQAHNILDRLKKSRKDKLEQKIPFDRWLKGEDYMLRSFIETISNFEALDERDLNEIRGFLRSFTRLVLYTLEKVDIDKYEEGMSFVRSFNMTCSLYLLVTKYSWSKMKYEHGMLSTTKGFENFQDDLADAVLLKTLAELLLERYELDRAYEAKDALVDQVSGCLRHPNAAHTAVSFTRPGLKHTNGTRISHNDVVEIAGNVFRFTGNEGDSKLDLVDFLDEKKFYSVKYVQPKKIYGFENATRD